MSSTIDSELEITYFGRGLPSGRLEEINATLPNTRAFRVATLTFDPSFIAMRCELGSGREQMPVAAICLQDTAYALSEARYAEAQASIALEIWRSPGGSGRVAVAQAQYYCADATHRLYAAGEHIARAILCIRGLAAGALNAGKKDKAVSLQARLAKHLKAARPNDPITAAVLKLGEAPCWRRSIDYRGDWVHDQAPIPEGIGESFNRHAARWHVVRGTDGSEIGHQLSVGGGDPSETTVENVLADSIAATTAFLELAAVVMDEYVASLRDVGIAVNLTSRQSSITIFAAADDAPDEPDPIST